MTIDVGARRVLLRVAAQLLVLGELILRATKRRGSAIARAKSVKRARSSQKRRRTTRTQSTRIVLGNSRFSRSTAPNASDMKSCEARGVSWGADARKAKEADVEEDVQGCSVRGAGEATIEGKREISVSDEAGATITEDSRSPVTGLLPIIMRGLAFIAVSPRRHCLFER